MRTKEKWKAVAALLLIAVMLCASALAESVGAKVIGSTQVYSSASGSQKRIGVLNGGTSVSVSSASGDWAGISYPGGTGYVPLNKLIFDQRIEMVTTKASKIRFITENSYRKGSYYTGTLKAGVTVYVAGVNGSYYLFFNSSGTAIGYVSKSAVRKAG